MATYISKSRSAQSGV